ncbi:MAG: YoaK family protein [Nakamurella sp.]
MSMHRPIQWALVVLSFGSGATDAFAFLALGGVFTANMTGNLVLVGLVGRPDYVQTLIASVAAVLAFLAALYLGFRVTRSGPSRLLPLLVGVGVVQAVVLGIWWSAGTGPHVSLDALMIVLSAVAMGWHTVLGRRLSARAGVSTTFVTGTLTALMLDLSEGRHEVHSLRLAAIGALVVGSFAGALLLLAAPGVGPVLPVVAVVVALLLMRRAA